MVNRRAGCASLLLASRKETIRPTLEHIRFRLVPLGLADPAAQAIRIDTGDRVRGSDINSGSVPHEVHKLFFAAWVADEGVSLRSSGLCRPACHLGFLQPNALRTARMYKPTGGFVVIEDQPPADRATGWIIPHPEVRVPVALTMFGLESSVDFDEGNYDPFIAAASRRSAASSAVLIISRISRGSSDSDKRQVSSKLWETHSHSGLVSAAQEACGVAGQPPAGEVGLPTEGLNRALSVKVHHRPLLAQPLRTGKFKRWGSRETPVRTQTWPPAGRQSNFGRPPFPRKQRRLRLHSRKHSRSQSRRFRACCFGRSCKWPSHL